MPDLFYIAIDGQQQGPFTIDELATKPLYKDTMVWTEGLENWIKAEYMPLLKDVIKVTPPPLNIPDAKATAEVKWQPIPEPLPHPYFGYELASRSDRLIAAILGGIITAIPLMAFRSYVVEGMLHLYYDDYGTVSLLYSAALSALVGALFYALWSGNLGHKIMGLKVISSEDGSDKKSAVAGVIREGLKSVLGTFVIPVIWILWDSDKQTIYDKVARTYVVKNKRRPGQV